MYCSLTHLVTALILTPNTPDCFLEGILLRLNSLLLKRIDSLTSICRVMNFITKTSHWWEHNSDQIIRNIITGSSALSLISNHMTVIIHYCDSHDGRQMIVIGKWDWILNLFISLVKVCLTAYILDYIQYSTILYLLYYKLLSGCCYYY